MDVISRLSTTAFRGRLFSLEDIDQHLRANYVLSGTYRTDGDGLQVSLELANVKSSRIVWADIYNDRVSGILGKDQELIGEVVAEVANAILSHELQRARANPLPNVESYTLLMGGIALMHRMSLDDFKEAHELLQAVIERSPPSNASVLDGKLVRLAGAARMDRRFDQRSASRDGLHDACS